MTDPGSMAGKTFGAFEIVRKLGHGGMGTVYEAVDRTLDRTVALKVLAEDLCGDPEFIKRFQREARAAAKLNHPNIAQIFAAGEQDRQHYLAMEYVKGKSVKDRITEEGRLAPDLAMEILKQASLGLAEAHAKGIVHRDVKPHNVLIDEAGNVKVADFGVAKLAQASQGLTATGATLGTPLYMSPEQIRGEPLDGRSDVFSLGIMLYEMLVGKPPYAAETPASLMYQIMERPLPNPGTPSFPHGVSRILGKMTAKKAEDRYPSAKSLAADIEAYLKGTPPPAAPAGENNSPCPNCGQPIGREAWACRFCGHESWQADPGPHPVLGGAGKSVYAIPAEAEVPPAGGGVAPGRVPFQDIGRDGPFQHFGVGRVVPGGAGEAFARKPAPLPTPPRSSGPTRIVLAVLSAVLVLAGGTYMIGRGAKGRGATPTAGGPAPHAAAALPAEMYGSWIGWCRDGETCLYRFLRDESVLMDDARGAMPLLTGKTQLGDPRKGPDALSISLSARVPPAEDSSGPDEPRTMTLSLVFDKARASKTSLSARDTGMDFTLTRLPEPQDSLRAEVIAAANLGSARAQTALADAYSRGRGMPRSEPFAEKWYRKAAEHGHARAQLRLGILLASRQGNASEKEEACGWLYTAESQGEAEARPYLAELESSMSVEQVGWASRHADRFARQLSAAMAKAVVGRWQGRDSPWTYEFQEGGAVTFRNPKLSPDPIHGTYALAQSRMKVSGTLLVKDPKTGRPSELALGYWLKDLRVSGKTLSHSGKDGKTYTYTRLGPR